MAKPGLFILGGSSYYTLLLLESLKSQAVAQGFSRITLFGRNRARLELIAELGNDLLAGICDVDISLDIETCLDSRYGFIFNQIRFGGMSSRDRDEKLALAYDLPADETIGIVGASNAIRAIEGMTPYLEVIRKKAKPYKLVNFTNPCSILTQYMVQYYQLPAIGICDYPEVMKVEIARALALPPSSLDLAYYGLNHFGVIHSVKHQGRELLPEVLAANLAFKPACNGYVNHLLNVSWRFVYERGQLVKEQQAATNRAAHLLAFEQEMDGLLNRGERELSAYFSVLNRRNCDWFNLVVSPLFARLLGQSREAVIANVPAKNAVTGGQEPCVMEGSCRENFDFIEPQQLPEQLLQSREYALIKVMKLSEQQLLTGILSRDKAKIIGACLHNPMIQDLHKILDYFAALCGEDPLIHSIFQPVSTLKE
ncbi:hypothetical protein [Thalassomonas haliotis]|uniref:6-phospho-beta-glucosidase n=1 Tax=Thalassomonas haliotis TaxID=485448 RepID=A0ABY7VBV1_9GAMM|nr:hypothetical protein [Thalassomonas haliotis]WDE11117.1 6-phospho-beta-glucosidase [Thalassomonas haliotis]